MDKEIGRGKLIQKGGGGGEGGGEGERERERGHPNFGKDFANALALCFQWERTWNTSVKKLINKKWKWLLYSRKCSYSPIKRTAKNLCSEEENFYPLNLPIAKMENKILPKAWSPVWVIRGVPPVWYLPRCAWENFPIYIKMEKKKPTRLPQINNIKKNFGRKIIVKVVLSKKKKKLVKVKMFESNTQIHSKIYKSSHYNHHY